MNISKDLEIVDGNGEKWVPKTFYAPKKPVIKKRDVRHLYGFVIYGWSQDQLSEAKRASSRPDLFDAETFAKNNCGKKLNAKPFALKSAANAFADLATKAGFIAVTIKEPDEKK
jgi:hypothetical protein